MSQIEIDIPELHQIGQIDLLPAIYGQISVPEAVTLEIDGGIAGGVDLPVLSNLAWVSTEMVNPASLQQVPTELGTGEREVLALGLESTNSLLILDDAQARKYAKSLGLKLTGTLGVLLKAKQQGTSLRSRRCWTNWYRQTSFSTQTRERQCSSWLGNSPASMFSSLAIARMKFSVVWR